MMYENVALHAQSHPSRSAAVWKTTAGKFLPWVAAACGTKGAQTVCMSYHVGAKEQYQSQFMLTRIVCILLVLISASGLSGTDFSMKVTDKSYLDTQGFSVFLYDSTYHPVFVDQKNTAMEMILHGQRIATNGDVRLMPTPEQWDLVATLKGRHADKANRPADCRPQFPDVRFQLHIGSGSGARRGEGQHQSR